MQRLTWSLSNSMLFVVPVALLLSCGESDPGGDPKGEDSIEFTIEAEPKQFWVRRGDTTEVQVAVSASGEPEELIVLRATGLPEGVAAGDVVLQPGDRRTASITFTASSDAPAGEPHVIHLEATQRDKVATTSVEMMVAGLPGELDRSYGEGGFTTAPIQLPHAAAGARFAVGTTGLYFLVWEGLEAQFSLRKISPDGRLDLEFGEMGVVKRFAERADYCNLAYSHHEDIIFTACRGGAGVGDTNVSDIVVGCVESSGRSGASCEKWDSVIVAGDQDASSRSPQIAVDDQGRMILAASIDDPSAEAPILQQYRLVANDVWQFDPSFGEAGKLSVEGIRGLSRIVVLDNGGTLLGGTVSTRHEGVLIKVREDGTLDEGFGDQGMLLLNLGSRELQVAGDAIYFISEENSSIISLTEAGAPRADFGMDGSLQFPEARLRSLAASGDGTLYTAVTITEGGRIDESFVEKISLQGEVDSDFRSRMPSDGAAFLNRSAIWVGVQPDGRLLVAYDAPFEAPDPTFLIARFWP